MTTVGIKRDRLTPERRSALMARVRQRDTDIEVAIRSALHRRGLRFRKNLPALPGRPDIAFPRARLAVFLDGDFWHGFDFDNRQHTLSEFWKTKISANIKRDADVNRRLQEMGWQVLRFWQHDVNGDGDAVVAKIISKYTKCLHHVTLRK